MSDYSFDLFPEELITSMPRLMEQEVDDTSKAIVYAHLYGQTGNWYFTEVDSKGEEGFGYVELSNMPENAEWGYIWIKELNEMNSKYIKDGNSDYMIRRDVSWKPKKFSEINLQK